METTKLPAPYAFFKQLVAADDALRKESRENRAMLTEAQQMSIYSRQTAFTVAIDLWDAMSKGVGNYDALLAAYRRFRIAMEHNAQSDDAVTGKPDPEAYKEILQMLDETGIDFNTKG